MSPNLCRMCCVLPGKGARLLDPYIGMTRSGSLLSGGGSTRTAKEPEINPKPLQRAFRHHDKPRPQERTSGFYDSVRELAMPARGEVLEHLQQPSHPDHQPNNLQPTSRIAKAEQSRYRGKSGEPLPVRRRGRNRSQFDG
ncbi:hypothetical protein MAE02_34700 [Microvirga aerophila]|uniref:Uncharacterized protein n=1 Tax=Microvirga aerophila TaxID=670291 RepID=A0A512BUX6_9HYPH|nr:hypothetical protein MAE02_34700 [Microvirga aerophila]